MPVSPEAYARYIRDLYAQAEETMLGHVARRLHRGVDEPGWAEWKLAESAAMNDELRGVARDLSRFDPEIRDAIIRAGQAGADDAVRELLAAGLGDSEGTPGRSEGVRALAKEAAGGIEQSRLQALRSCMDGYREVTAFASGQSVSGTMTIRQAVQLALDRWADAGISGFRDKAGRQWDLASYAEMTVRTATARARIQGHADKLVSRGRDLVRVSDSPSECPLCRPWERRVLSLTGKTEGYPTVEAARAAGLYHQNCSHRHYLWVPGVSPERTAKANPKGYEQRQDQRRIERQIRQWKRRSAVAGNDRDRALADRKVKFYQQKMDSFIEETGRLRQRNRERFIILERRRTGCHTGPSLTASLTNRSKMVQ